MEPPGTAPGSDRFITTPVYRHSRPLRDGTPNIGAERLRRKASRAEPRVRAMAGALRCAAGTTRALSLRCANALVPASARRYHCAHDRFARRSVRHLAANQNAPTPPPSLTELFLAFSNMALHGFGGVLPWARRTIVEDKRWMTAQEFNEAFTEIGQFLPGANIVNLAVVFGSRLHGAAGAAVALAGLLIPPVAIVLVLGMLYGRYGDTDALQRAFLAGVAAAAAGLLGATAVKMTQPLLREGVDRDPRYGGAAFLSPSD